MSYKQIRSSYKSFSSYNCGKSGLYLLDCRSKQSKKGEGDRNKEGGRVMNLEKTVADLTESSSSGQLATPEMKKSDLENSDVNELINVSNLKNVWRINREFQTSEWVRTGSD